MKALQYNYRDLFRAPRLAFGIQRIWINGLGFLLGYVDNKLSMLLKTICQKFCRFNSEHQMAPEYKPHCFIPFPRGQVLKDHQLNIDL